MPEIIKTAQKFDELIKAPQLTVVHFFADWVEQCKQIDAVLDALSEEPDNSKVKFAKCDAEDISDISLRYKIEAAPTVIFFRSGRELTRINGVDPNGLLTALKTHNTATEGGKTESLEDRLKSLINRHKVMLFMKGNREVPRCGFSRQIIEILRGTGVDFDTFDILSDEEVRQGLKSYSDWPTYPQLYVKGDLLGGLDIIKEMQAAGELSSALKD